MRNNKLQERPAVLDSQNNIVRVRKIWDNGGKTCDRFSVTFDIYNDKTGRWEAWSDYADGRLSCLGMSNDPISPQGFSQFSSCIEGRHLGGRIAFSDLPELIQNHIKLRMKH
ncbi:MAG: hypothetical protein ACYC54_15025 [Sedimentisphaerales bacterium]